jgi:hypothetical protein
MPAEEPSDDRQVDHHLAFGQALERFDEDGSVADSVLEEITEPLGVLLEELHRVRRLHVLLEQENGDVRVELANRRAATMPSSVWVGGMRMSTIAQWGSCAASALMRSVWLPASATTSTPSSRSTRTISSRRANLYPFPHGSSHVDRNMRWASQ